MTRGKRNETVVSCSCGRPIHNLSRFQLYLDERREHSEGRDSGGQKHTDMVTYLVALHAHTTKKNNFLCSVHTRYIVDGIKTDFSFIYLPDRRTQINEFIHQ